MNKIFLALIILFTNFSFANTSSSNTLGCSTFTLKDGTEKTGCIAFSIQLSTDFFGWLDFTQGKCSKNIFSEITSRVISDYKAENIQDCWESNVKPYNLKTGLNWLTANKSNYADAVCNFMFISVENGIYSASTM